jgi:ribose-phosphate pyrophosphokinase
MVKFLVDGQERKFTTTIFPDGTSQVWKLDLEPEEGDRLEILWLFENEAELFHVCQLAHLLSVDYDYSPDLIVPYLPYGRQDKDVTNTLSFALSTFKEVLKSVGVIEIKTFDAHSYSGDMIISIDPTKFHKAIFNHDVVCFPDKGAAVRYGEAQAFNNTPIIYCEKVRNQATGEITGLKLNQATSDLLFNKKVLIVDDLCDGGMTFIKVAEKLKELQPSQIDLAVSHGIFSKGKHVLYDAGISNIYTTNSLLRNPEGFRVW